MTTASVYKQGSRGRDSVIALATMDELLSHNARSAAFEVVDLTEGDDGATGDDVAKADSQPPRKRQKGGRGRGKGT